MLLVARVGRLLLAAEEGKQQQQEEGEQEGERYDTAARESYLCHLHRGQKQLRLPPNCCFPQFLASTPLPNMHLPHILTQIDCQPPTVFFLVL